ncbi:fam-a protein [Plasmodium vinckei lentum]|uniref:Fam-a protein n=1 Tax=Plasmodium vinckei lentum TaxID=138297 RepID=A0A6V7RUK1_PLAVN|nr:fam-a protein [Plasmodium vinckei lentum]
MNKFYIQIVFFLLSITLYANNKTIATEPVPEENTTLESKSHYPTSEEVYEKNKHLLCANRNETINAEKLMNEAVTHLAYHATNKDGYELCNKHHDDSNYTFYKKKHDDNTYVLKAYLKHGDPDKYNKVVNKFWNPDCINLADLISVTKKAVRVYNPNLIMIQQRYKKKSNGRQKYFYALAKKAQISENKTIIVMTSVNINDHNPSNKEYKNAIIESANLFEASVIPDEDIKNGELEKIFVSISGYLIEKKDECVDITFIESVSDTQILAT